MKSTAPVTGGLRAVTETVNGIFSGAGNYWDAARQNEQLRSDAAYVTATKHLVAASILATGTSSGRPEA